jgi:hypothetical protein
VKKLLFIILLTGSLAATSVIKTDKYIYSYQDNIAIPSSRVEISTGTIEIYTNIDLFTVTKKHLRAIQKESYSNLPFKEFLSKVIDKYGEVPLEVKEISDYKWIEYNKYLKAKNLPVIPPNELLK